MYSPYNVKRAQALAWVRANAAVLLLVILAAGGMFGYSEYTDATVEAEVTCADSLNTQAVVTASRYLVLRGKVEAGGQFIQAATVMASRDTPRRASAPCVEPLCSSEQTDSDGDFAIDLTKIKARNGDDIILSVEKQGVGYVTDRVTVDVRAIDVKAVPLRVELRP
jgi:hypothetical protein